MKTRDSAKSKVEKHVATDVLDMMPIPKKFFVKWMMGGVSAFMLWMWLPEITTFIGMEWMSVGMYRVFIPIIYLYWWVEMR